MVAVVEQAYGDVLIKWFGKVGLRGRPEALEAMVVMRWSGESEISAPTGRLGAVDVELLVNPADPPRLMGPPRWGIRPRRTGG